MPSKADTDTFEPVVAAESISCVDLLDRGAGCAMGVAAARVFAKPVPPSMGTAETEAKTVSALGEIDPRPVQPSGVAAKMVGVGTTTTAAGVTAMVEAGEAHGVLVWLRAPPRMQFWPQQPGQWPQLWRMQRRAEERRERTFSVRRHMACSWLYSQTVRGVGVGFEEPHVRLMV